jgi:fatty-acid desaturase
VAVDYHQYPVLVVDDEPDILRSFRFNYGEDFDILTAESGARGLELLAGTDVAVIVADQRMPQMSGTEFLERSMDVRPGRRPRRPRADMPGPPESLQAGYRVSSPASTGARRMGRARLARPHWHHVHRSIMRRRSMCGAVDAAASPIETAGQGHARQINWVNANALVAIHVAALGAFWTFSAEGLACCLVMITLTLNFGLIVRFHRLLSHRSFVVPRWVELPLAFLGTCAAEAGPITWVAVHRKHHAHADRQEDPHSPSAGWWWAYVGWTYHRFDVDLQRWAKDLYADPAYRWLERWSAVIVVGVAGWLWLLGYLLGGQRLALSFLFWGFFVRILYTWHTSFLVNSRAHAAAVAPSRPVETAAATCGGWE